eukprot:CAMPEP_0172212612 /NCGR_PEP_ID=MMETSP1050-20130122/37116_1 /TAXON_ID=233186 /ORGANISM="Cryptomonas curvata, Strain CCAP979/52" /LENGTH=95 /DNA_ID=CAMNT_0012893317 /DNA_START=73 /DNA_END=356 /DNA_ORIENTATION=-
MTNGPSIVISGTLLTLGKIYSIVVKAENAFGLSSDFNAHNIELSTFSVPVILMEIPPPPYFRSRDLFVSTSATHSVCSDNQHTLSFNWNIYKDDP